MEIATYTENFSVLETDTIQTSKLEYTNTTNIIQITQNNSNHIVLTNDFSNSVLITKDSDLNIHILLNTQYIGTKYKIILTNPQLSLKISSCFSNDNIIGSYVVNHNSNINDSNVIDRKLKKKYINKSTSTSEIFYINKVDFGLYNGGTINLNYIGNEYCNTPTNTEKGNWLLTADLVGNIKIPKYILKDDLYELNLYVSLTSKRIIYAVGKNSQKSFFHKYDNNNIQLFLNVVYNKVLIIDSENNTILFDSTGSNNSVTMKLKTISNTIVDVSNNLNFSSIPNDFNNITNYFITTEKKLFNTNIIYYKIVDQTNTLILDGYLNIIDTNAYYNSDTTTAANEYVQNIPNILFSSYNAFTERLNNINII